MADWNASLYLRFEAERTRPSHDLLARVPLASPKRIVDLGCGPGNSTAVLVERYPRAAIEGMDSSPAMIDKARKTLPGVPFQVADLESYRPSSSSSSSDTGDPSSTVDLFFSNAVFQWLPASQRIPILQSLITSQSTGGVFAMQVPDNMDEPSHVAMRETAMAGPWRQKLEAANPVRDPVPSPRELYEALHPLCERLDIWQTSYQHILADHQAVVEWVKSTGLRPFLDPLDEEEQKAFLHAYLGRLREAYLPLGDGKIMLTFPRLFLVAIRK
ncbi:hypothetical protein ASPZODRAFT_67300 [Penicilliopsis zonata CBS 506.65]|uniref:Methyltransferase domain-containing protein n=1 Tax=Penicilliopsis zonata CBS 506.65 TaxID=1073090 RepID=A0A1L9SFK8_9EURO|nr:hypothetical protein ASPZODRAFT_67300 [Penicilliopsis zonata CBS 506.65]OJJ46020.1 hypothetical protein ASPZODRAFT_67300 [Penicilliopsis zonata CBS 506.65]